MKRLGSVLVSSLAFSCSSAPPPVVEAPKVEEPHEQKHASKPDILYDLGSVDPNVAKARFDTLKSEWNACFMEAHEKNEALSGSLTFTLRTHQDGSVKWAYVTKTDLGDLSVERCVIESVKPLNFGPPDEAKEGEIKEKTVGWELDGDEGRPADHADESSVMPAISKAKKKLAECREKAEAQGSFSATIYVAPKGKPKSIGLAISDPSGEAALDCIADVLSKLHYTNKSSYTTKVTVVLP